MGPENVEEFALAKEGGPEYEARMAMYGDAFAVATKDNVVEMFGGLLSEPDKAVLEPSPHARSSPRRCDKVSSSDGAASTTTTRRS